MTFGVLLHLQKRGQALGKGFEPETRAAWSENYIKKLQSVMSGLLASLADHEVSTTHLSPREVGIQPITNNNTKLLWSAFLRKNQLYNFLQVLITYI